MTPQVPRAGLWSSSIADSLPRNMFPANLVEATFKQVSGSQSDGVGRPGPAWEGTGLPSKSPCLLGARCRRGGKTWILEPPPITLLPWVLASHEGGGFHCAPGLHPCSRSPSQSVRTVTPPSMCRPLSQMRKLRHGRIKGPAQGYATSK